MEGVMTLEKDRGMKKWYGFSIPEHTKMLKTARHDYYKTPRPQLDEGRIDDMELLLLDSFQNKTLLEITSWKDGFFNSMVRVVIKIDPINKNIITYDESASAITLNFYNITNVTTK